MSTAAGRRTPAGSGRPPRERLLSAAEHLFGERSYYRTSVAEICARAGIATGSFYAHFDSKAGIFAAVIRQINSDLRAAMSGALAGAEQNQRARERACLRAYFDLMSKRPWIYRIVREAEFVAPPEFRAYYERLTHGYADGVRTAQAEGDVDPKFDPEVIAYLYTGLGHFIGMRWAEWTAGGRVPDEVLDDLMAVLAAGLPPRELARAGQRVRLGRWGIAGERSPQVYRLSHGRVRKHRRGVFRNHSRPARAGGGA